MLTNTRYFSESAIHFTKFGVYCKAPKGSKDYHEYWKQQKDRCINGYKVGDLWITGKMYFYLNFFPMLVTPPTTTKRGTVTKVVGFPSFFEVQLEWWNAKHIAWYGSSYNDYEGIHYVRQSEKSDVLMPIYASKILKPSDYEGGKHIVCAKTRGCGFSYMDASEGVYNYNFIPKSKSFYMAFLEKYLLGEDGVLLKAWDGLDHLNQNTQGYWRKNRHEKDTQGHKRASYIETNTGEKKGFKSEISGITVDNPRKVRGARGLKITLEEAGSFPNLLATIAAIMPLITDGTITTGQISCFGTGGEENEYIEGLETLFYNPEPFDFMAFNNPWEDNGLDTVGFFVPSYIADKNFIDKDGNADVEASKISWQKQFDKLKNAGRAKDADLKMAERPFTPSMLFQRTNFNCFPLGEINEQIKRIKLSRTIQGLILNGDIVNDKESVKFIPNEKQPIIKYPHKHTDDLNGCVTQFEKPYVETNGRTPANLYFITVDPYAIDGAEDLTSLFCCYVWQRHVPNLPDSKERIVASYIGRPQLLETCYRITDMLSIQYNATIQSEIVGGGKSMFDYFKAKKKLHKLEFQPEMLNSKEVNSVRNRQYFMSVTEDMKRDGIAYLADWLVGVVGLTEEGNEIYNLHYIYDLGLLTEFTKFNAKGNFDRISSCILAMYMFKEKAEQAVTSTKNKSNFFNKPLFADSRLNNGTGLRLIRSGDELDMIM